MYKPAGIRASHAKISTPVKKRISVTLITFFVLIHLAFAQNCGFIKLFNKKFQCVLKLASLCLTFWVVIVNTMPLLIPRNYAEPGSWLAMLTLLECVGYISILEFAKTSVYEFLIKVNYQCGSKDGNGKETIIGVLAFVNTFILVFSQMSGYAFFCSSIGKEYCEIHFVFLPFAVPAIYSLCTDFVPTILAIIAYHKVRCVLHLRQFLRKTEIDLDATKKLYFSVANLFDDIGPLYHNLLMMTLTAKLPKLLLTMHYTLQFIKLQTGFATFLSQFIYIAHGIIQIIVPAIIGERVKYEIEQIKLELHSHIMANEDDVRLRDRVHNLLGYMEARRLQRLAWRFVPTDLRLPIALWGLCTTYFILLLQFSHLID